MKKEKFIASYPSARKWIEYMPDEIYNRGKIYSYKKGETVKYVGENMQSVYIVCTGGIMIASNNLNGSEMSVTLVEPGSLVGEMEALTNKLTYTYSVKGFRNGIVFELPVNQFLKWMDQEVFVCKKVAEILAEKLYLSSSTTVQYNSWDGYTRVKVFLLNYGAGKVNVTRNTIATACGISERTTQRAIAKLKEENFIDLQHGKIHISVNQIRDMINSIEI